MSRIENNEDVSTKGSKEETNLNISVNLDSGLNRFGMFKILMKNAFEEISSGVSEDTYIKLFGGLSALKKSKSAPMKMLKTMKTKLSESLNSDFDHMVQEEQMEEKFNNLESIVDECALYEGRETWRPNGNVDDHVRSHLMEKKLKYKCLLEEYVREKEQATEMLKQKVLELRVQTREAEEALHQLKDICLDTSVIETIEQKIQISEHDLNFN